MATFANFVRSSAQFLSRHSLRATNAASRHVAMRAAAAHDNESRAQAVARLLPTVVIAAGGAAVVHQESHKRINIEHELLEAQLPDLSQVPDVMPKSIEMLVTNNIPVPPRRLLEDLDWEMLVALQDPHAQAGVTRTRRELEMYEARNLLLDPATAKEIMARYATWLCLQDIQVMLDTTPDGRAALDEAMRDMGTSVEALQRKRDKVQELMTAERYHEAAELAERAIAACDRTKELLAHIIDRLQGVQVDDRERIFKYLALSGACVIVGVGCYYLGVAPKVPDFSHEVFQTLTGLAVTGTVVCLGQSAMAWYASEQSVSHYRRMREAQTARYNVSNKLKALLDECVFSKY